MSLQIQLQMEYLYVRYWKGKMTLYHFAEIKHKLLPITDRALSQTLKTMETRNWVCREVDVKTRPPRSCYTAISTGKIISEAAVSAVTNF